MRCLRLRNVKLGSRLGSVNQVNKLDAVLNEEDSCNAKGVSELKVPAVGEDHRMLTDVVSDLQARTNKLELLLVLLADKKKQMSLTI